jgi:UDP-glucose 4-epimerase
MRMLVTGGAGFIGSTLVDRLLAEGHTVDVIDDLSTGRFANLADARTATSHEFTFQQLDVRSPDLAALVRRRRPTVIYHLAAIVDPTVSAADPVLDTDVNIGGSLRVLDAARAAGVAKVVFASSASIYGAVKAADLPLTERHVQRPLTAEGVAKKAVGDYLVAYRERYDLEFSALALGHVYGPRQDRKGAPGVAAVFARQLLAGEPCQVTGTGSQTRDFVYVDDVVDALARAAERGSGVLLNIGTGVETSISALHQVMAAVAGVKAPPVHVPAVPGELARSALDPSRAALQLGWKPWTGLLEGIEATFGWVRSAAGEQWRP